MTPSTSLQAAIGAVIAWLEVHWPAGVPWSPPAAAGVVLVVAWVAGRIARPLLGWLGVAAVTCAAGLLAGRLLGVG